MIKESGIITALTWVQTLLSSPIKARTKAKKLVIDSVKLFKKGKISDDGLELAALLNSKKVKFVGFTPNITYIKEQSPYRDELTALWCHPFSTYSLLFKHADLPMLLIVNPNLDLDESRLRKIKANSSMEELKNILGITG